MICFAKNDDLENILELWDESFPNEQEFRDFFFDNIYKREDTLIYKKDGRVVSMLQMLEYDTSVGKTTYIYGACTAKTHRKQGLMEKLLNRSFEISKDRGHKFSILIPQEEWLFGFYEKYGYKAKLEILNSEFLKNNDYTTINVSKLKESDIPECIAIYNEKAVSHFYIKRNNNFYKDQLNLFADMAIKIYENNNMVGYAFCYIENDNLVLQEIISNELEKSLNAICKYFKKDKLTFCTMGKGTKIGSIKNLYGDIEPMGYINLLFN